MMLKNSKELHEKLREKVLSDPESLAEYEAFRIRFELAKSMRKKREAAKMTQQEVAEKMHANKPLISRLESSKNTKHLPALSTLCKYAMALGYTLKVSLIPIKEAKEK